MSAVVANCDQNISISRCRMLVQANSNAFCLEMSSLFQLLVEVYMINECKVMSAKSMSMLINRNSIVYITVRIEN